MFLLKEYIFKIEDFFQEIVLRKNDELVVKSFSNKNELYNYLINEKPHYLEYKVTSLNVTQTKLVINL